MEFLVTEFSTENLLCFVELTQFTSRWRRIIAHHIYKQIFKLCLSIDSESDR